MELSLRLAVLRQSYDTFVAPAKLMLEPTARQLEQRAEEARAVAARMRDPWTKRAMANLALTYERLAKFAADREARDKDATIDTRKDKAALALRARCAFVVILPSARKVKSSL